MAVANEGYSSSEAMTALENLTEDMLGNNFGYEWTSIAYQEKLSSSSVTMIFVLAIILVLLVLAAMYESWTNPFAVILSVPLALLGVIAGCIVMSLPISIYSQIFWFNFNFDTIIQNRKNVNTRKRCMSSCI